MLLKYCAYKTETYFHLMCPYYPYNGNIRLNIIIFHLYNIRGLSIFTVPSSVSTPPPLSFLVAIFPVPFFFVNSPIDCSSDLPGAPCLGDLPSCTRYKELVVLLVYYCFSDLVYVMLQAQTGHSSIS